MKQPDVVNKNKVEGTSVAEPNFQDTATMNNESDEKSYALKITFIYTFIIFSVLFSF